MSCTAILAQRLRLAKSWRGCSFESVATFPDAHDVQWKRTAYFSPGTERIGQEGPRTFRPVDAVPLSDCPEQLRADAGRVGCTESLTLGSGPRPSSRPSSRQSGRGDRRRQVVWGSIDEEQPLASSRASGAANASAAHPMQGGQPRPRRGRGQTGRCR